jgi:hypothetical protein
MANKTQPTDVKVEDFLAGVEPERRRVEGLRILEIMRDVTGEQGTMWGPTMVGFGTYNYRYATGNSGDWFKVGFSPRKAKISFYGLQDSSDAEPLLAKLGPHTLGVGCVYANRLDALDEDVLRELTRLAYARGDYVA